MATKAKDTGINAELESFLTVLAKKAKNDPDISLLDKLRIADRLLKLEALRLKVRDDGFGSGFDDPDES